MEDSVSTLEDASSPQAQPSNRALSWMPGLSPPTTGEGGAVIANLRLQQGCCCRLRCAQLPKRLKELTVNVWPHDLGKLDVCDVATQNGL